ncbi:hypothetical protein TIFTF001_050830 [Ficus carica]|uniref:Uncharacterized protein n=1 Tax=Ficus carica TaxID=3494 RepID=A0AA87YTZ2_FICCA|nr:hypothetical protein TIFTF001_050830 [Ficus carica]
MNPLSMSFIIAGGCLQLRPSQEQHYTGHSRQGKYNSAYNISFCCETYPTSLPVSYRPALGRVGLWFELEMDWPPQPLHSCVPGTDTYVSNLRATSDARWGSVAGRTVRCVNDSRYAFCPSITDDMDPARVDEDRDAVTSFYESYPLIFDGTRRTVSVAAWLYDMGLIFRICHIEARLQVSLASRCFATDTRLWWMTLGEREMPSRTWAHFRTLVIARFGPVLDEGAGVPYCDPEIYQDMHHTRLSVPGAQLWSGWGGQSISNSNHSPTRPNAGRYYTRYLSYVADWHAYPQETMSHYCRRFQEAMLPHIPQELHSPELQALVILRNGLPHQIRQYVPIPMLGMTVGNMIDDILGAEIIAHAMQADDFVGDHQAPVDDAGMGEPIHEAGPIFPEDPVPAVPLPEVPP